MFYLYVLTETDGNDATKYDIVVEAPTKQLADEQISTHFDALAKEKEWDIDGNGGYFFPCDCEIPEMPEDEFPCPQCEAIAIDGVNCHETGCPIEHQRIRLQRAIDFFECPGHGGIDISEPEEFATEEEAEDECASYHTRYEV